MGDRDGVDTGGFGGRKGWSAGKGCAVAAGIGCLLAIAALVTCVGGGAFLFQRTTSGATAEIEPFFEAIGDERYEDAYDRVAASWKASATPEAFREQFAAFRDDLGRLEALHVRGVRFESGDEEFREVVYAGEFERGTARILVRLETDDDGVERIAGVRIDSRSRPGADASDLPPDAVVVGGDDAGGARPEADAR